MASKCNGRGNNGGREAGAAGSLHNGGASESLIRSLPLEVYKSHHAPVSADLDESSAGLEMGLLRIGIHPKT